MMTTEIKPCPHCGGSDIAVCKGETFRWMFAECRDCGAQASEVRVQTIGSGTREEWKASGEARAIEEWNKRAEVTTPPAASGAAPADIQSLKEKIHQALRVADNVGRSRGTNPYAMNRGAVEKIVDLTMEIDAALDALASREAAQPASPVPLTDGRIEAAARRYCGGPNQTWAFPAKDLLSFAREIAALASPQVAPEDGKDREALRQALGEVLSSTLAGMCEDDVAPDWYDSRHIDEVLDELMPVIRIHVDPQMANPAWTALAAPVQVAPTGWKPVPTKVTTAMQEAWDRSPASEDSDADFRNAYAAMLAAAPMQPGTAADDARDAARKPMSDYDIARLNMAVGGDYAYLENVVRQVEDFHRLSTPAAKPAEEQGS